MCTDTHPIWSHPGVRCGPAGHRPAVSPASKQSKGANSSRRGGDRDQKGRLTSFLLLNIPVEPPLAWGRISSDPARGEGRAWPQKESCLGLPRPHGPLTIHFPPASSRKHRALPASRVGHRHPLPPAAGGPAGRLSLWTTRR